MSMMDSAYSSAGRDCPRAIQTKTCIAMAAAILAVTLQGRSEDDQHTQWLDVLTFGRVAEDLIRHQRGPDTSPKR